MKSRSRSEDLAGSGIETLHRRLHVNTDLAFVKPVFV